MSTKTYRYPPGTDVIGTAEPNGQVRINRAFADYHRGLEDVSKRVCANLDASTATAEDIVNALIAADLMKAS